MLEARGERIHPASAQLANESRHIESESAEHDLHCFQALRRMDEILVANFMVFHDLVREEHYDLWIGDEAWELDYYLHENPEQKRAAVRLADRLRRLAADARRRRARGVPDRRLQRRDDRAHRALPARARPGDLRRQPRRHRPRRFGPDLPLIRDWTEEHFDFAGYVTGFDPAEFADREALRAELGYRPDEQVCIVTVGGSGVGGAPAAPRDRGVPGGQAARARRCG